MSWKREFIDDPREQRIWDVAYATTFALELDRRILHWMQEPATKLTGPRIEWEMNNTSAEVAAGRADLAVQRFREWKKSENSYLGQTIGIRPDKFGEKP